MEAEPVQMALSKFRAAQRPMSETTHGTEPSFLSFRRATKGSRGAKEGWGSQEGAREPYGALAPFCLRRQTAAFSPVNTVTPGRRRRPLFAP